MVVTFPYFSSIMSMDYNLFKYSKITVVVMLTESWMSWHKYEKSTNFQVEYLGVLVILNFCVIF